MYKVINRFKDVDGKVYEKNDRFNSQDEERVKTLSTRSNRYNRVFIVEDNVDGQEVVEQENQADGIDVNDMTVPQLKDALDQLNIDYKASAKKEELIELLESVASDETPKEGD